MNDRLDSRILSASGGARFRTSLLPDEPIFSYVARAEKLAITRTQESIKTELFANGKTQIGRPLHSGLSNFAAAVLGSSQHADALIAQHGLIAIYRPFIPPTRYEVAIERIKGAVSNGKLEPTIRRSVEIFRTHPAACPGCIQSDKAKYGFAYFRRSHLIRAVTHCPEHQIPLVDYCPNCGTTFSLGELLSLTCHHCGDSIVQDQNVSAPTEQTASAVRLSQFCEAALAGQIDWHSEGSRLAAYRRRTSEIVRNRSGIVGHNLARHLERSYGKNLLERLGLSPHRAPTLGWPALLIQGRVLVDDPIANCLLLAALFDSPAHYVEYVVSAQEAIASETETLRRQLVGLKAITPQLLRDAIRLPLKQAAAKHGACHGDLKQWVGAYPGLSERRNAKSKLTKLENYKRVLADLLAERPELSRTATLKLRKGAMKFVLRYDSVWLDEILPKGLPAPAARGKGPKAPERPPRDDMQASDWLQTALSAEFAESVRPVHRTVNQLFRLSGMFRVPLKERVAFPTTMNFIRAFAESDEAFYRRNLQWAASDLRRTYKRCDNLAELFVHAQVPLKLVRPLQDFAETLLIV